ncbi:hypothetical protein C8R43DRAFT_1143049 [Mycena crocata]|nr:hypothetical protein C8R43DRAFT_1143049 [Mycena crocata]
MSSEVFQPFPFQLRTGNELKRHKHAEAQCWYRERKLDETRAKARERMARLRMSRTPEEVGRIREERREGDADYRELMRHRKFKDTYGNEAFLDLYYPEYKLQGKRHLPGLRFDPAELKKRKEEKDAQEKDAADRAQRKAKAGRKKARRS